MKTTAENFAWKFFKFRIITYTWDIMDEKMILLPQGFADCTWLSTLSPFSPWKPQISDGGEGDVCKKGTQVAEQI